MKSFDEMTISDSFLIAFIIFMALAVSVIVVATCFNADPHVNDEDYCQQYARDLDWRITANYAVDPVVAERVCSCTYHEFKGYTGNGTGPMYPGVHYCERK